MPTASTRLFVLCRGCACSVPARLLDQSARERSKHGRAIRHGHKLASNAPRFLSLCPTRLTQSRRASGYGLYVVLARRQRECQAVLYKSKKRQGTSKKRSFFASNFVLSAAFSCCIRTGSRLSSEKDRRTTPAHADVKSTREGLTSD